MGQQADGQLGTLPVSRLKVPVHTDSMATGHLKSKK